jgi:hypothetical protein
MPGLAPITADKLAGRCLVIDLRDVPVVGTSYSAYVYANEPVTLEAHRLAPESGFLDRVAVFGHGECGGDSGHCGFTSREAVDPRIPFHAAPQHLVLDLTYPAQDYIEHFGPIQKLRMVTYGRRSGTKAFTASAEEPRQLPFPTAAVRLTTREVLEAEVRAEAGLPSQPQPAVLVELTALQARLQDLEATLRRVSPIEVVLRNGRMLRVGASADAATVAQLAAALEA